MKCVLFGKSRPSFPISEYNVRLDSALSNGDRKDEDIGLAAEFASDDVPLVLEEGSEEPESGVEERMIRASEAEMVRELEFAGAPEEAAVAVMAEMMANLDRVKDTHCGLHRNRPPQGRRRQGQQQPEIGSSIRKWICQAEVELDAGARRLLRKALDNG